MVYDCSRIWHHGLTIAEIDTIYRSSSIPHLINIAVVRRQPRNVKYIIRAFGGNNLIVALNCAGINGDLEVFRYIYEHCTTASDRDDIKYGYGTAPLFLSTFLADKNEPALQYLLAAISSWGIRATVLITALEEGMVKIISIIDGLITCKADYQQLLGARAASHRWTSPVAIQWMESKSNLS